MFGFKKITVERGKKCFTLQTSYMTSDFRQKLALSILNNKLEETKLTNMFVNNNC